uniref:Uncharacterized protein n=1 Tax=Bionectria ochroleuca TaxID=29856 RepID=A0A8H7TN03_BIOOC
MTKYKMNNYLTSVNIMLDYGLAVQQLIEKRWPGAIFTWIDMHSLVMDVIASLAEYFEQPANATHRICQGKASCGSMNFTLRSEFDEYLADEFIQALEGNSKYSKTYRPIYHQ